MSGISPGNSQRLPRRLVRISRRQKLPTRVAISRQKKAIAAKEMREALFWLRLIRACGLCPQETVQPLLQEAHELTAMLTAGMKRLHPIAMANLTFVGVALLSEF